MGRGGDYSKWSVPFIPLAPRPLSSPISSPLFLLQETVYEGYLFLIESEKKGVGGGGNGRTMSYVPHPSDDDDDDDDVIGQRKEFQN